MALSSPRTAGLKRPKLSQKTSLSATLLQRKPATQEQRRHWAGQRKAASAWHDWLET